MKKPAAYLFACILIGLSVSSTTPVYSGKPPVYLEIARSFMKRWVVVRAKVDKTCATDKAILLADTLKKYEIKKDDWQKWVEHKGKFTKTAEKKWLAKFCGGVTEDNFFYADLPDNDEHPRYFSFDSTVFLVIVTILVLAGLSLYWLFLLVRLIYRSVGNRKNTQ